MSDTDYDELHEFAGRLLLPRRGFDLDHYDVPASRYEHAISLGARPVAAREIVHVLRDSGLRVRQYERDHVAPLRRRQYLLDEWAALAEPASEGRSSYQTWQQLGDELIMRWNEPHRSYHDERHLEDVLLSLNHLSILGERIAPATLLAAWFHDAIYTGRGPDERDSADLAVTALREQGLAPSLVQHVGELIVATTPAIELPRVDVSLAHLLDSDLAIFAASETRYERYAAAVRAEYAHVPELQFREGRTSILLSYLESPNIYRTGVARTLWEERARVNLAKEIRLLGS